MFNQCYDSQDVVFIENEDNVEDNYSIKLGGLIETVREKVNPGAKK